MSHNNSNLAEEHTRARMSVVEDNPTVKNKTVNGERTADKKKTVSVGKTSAKKPVEMGKASARKKPADMGKASVKKKSANTDKKAVRKKPSNGKKATAAKVPADTRKKNPEKKAKNVNGEDFEIRVRKRDEERIRRREARLRRVRRQKIIMAVSSAVIVLAVIGIVVFCTPSMKLSRSLSKADKCAARAEYADAQGAYETALEIDSGSVRAYRGMAANYLAQEQTQEAKQILYTGWEQTQDQGVLDYYCTVIYNEAVIEINNKNCTLATVDKCIQVLEQKPGHEDALNLMDTCYERLFKVAEDDGTCEMFYDEDAAQDTCSYNEYERLLRRLLTLYQTNPSDRIRNILVQYAVIDMPYVRISVPHMAQYATLLTDINAVTGDTKITETIACLNRAEEVEEYFDAAFTEFEAGNYAYARDLVAQESYQQIRDDFINENSGYWEGSTYIPVSREQIVLHNENGQVRFSFLSDEEYNNKQGIIRVWGTKQEDDGVQRSIISYLPVENNTASEYTEYKVEYLYSNVKIGNQYVPQMNYRFDTITTTAEGTTTSAIGDWGGEHEWAIDY